MKRILLLLIPLAILGGLIGWRVNQKKSEEAAQATARAARGKAPISVQTALVTRKTVEITLEAVGTLEAPVAVDLAPKLAGRVIYLKAEEGDRVTAGQVLAQIEASDLEAEIRRKQATVAESQARLAEAQYGQDPNNVALTAEVRKQEAAVATAQAQQQQAIADNASKVAAAEATVTDAQGRIEQAEASIGEADATIARADATITTAQANLANAQTKLGRQQTLFKEGAVAQQVVDDAQTVVDVQEAAVNEAKQQRAAAVAQKNSAIATRSSAIAQKKAAEKQVEVTKNQTKATVQTAQEAVRQAKASLESARANTGRKPAYARNLEALQANVRAAIADLRYSEAQRSATVLRAPVTGVITKKYLDQGSVASPTAPVVAVQAVQQVWANVGVPEEETRRLYPGQPATVTLDSFPGKKFNGRIAQIEPAADPRSRQVAVRVTLDNSQNQFKPGMYARVILTANRYQNALTAPREAVKVPRKQDQPASVVVADNDKASVREVRIGPSDGQVYIIESGVNEGDKVVILTGRDLKDGQAIKENKEGGAGGKGEGAAEADSGEKGAAAGNRSEGGKEAAK